LGRVLLDMGLVDDEAYNSSLQALAQGQGLQGQILLSMGAITMPSLIRGLKEQLTRKLIRLFTMANASYAYYDGVNFLRGYGGDEVLRIDPFPVLYMGVRASYDDARLDQLLGPVAGQPMKLLDTADVRRFGLNADEVDLCTMIHEQPLTVEQLQRHSPIPPAHARALAYCLLITKQVEFIQTAAALRGASTIPQPPSSPVEPAAPAREGSGRLSAPPPASKGARPSPPPPERRGPPGGSPRRKSAPAVQLQPVGDPEVDAKRKEIVACAEKIETQSYFEMLGVPKDASSDAVRDAYFKLAKTFHPDRARAGLEDLRDTLEYIFSNFNEAYSTLSDKEKRSRYVALLREGGGTLADQKKIMGIVDGAMNYQKAEVCLRRKDFAEAERLAQLAVEASPDDGEYLALFAWIQVQQRPAEAKVDDLIDKLKKAQARAKEAEKPNFYLAMTLKRGGQMPAAIIYFKRASIANPRNLDALRELRLWEMRKEKGGNATGGSHGKGGGPKGKEPQGLFGRFFKK
jgi:curved DNA-binding protein CbpA